jgi:uncharacterized membrane protein YkvA (DUF1232 family)
MIVRNVFFDIALKQAARLLGRKRRLLVLLGKFGMKLKDVNWSEIKRVDLKSKFLVIGRLIKAYALGQYKSVPWKAILLITGAALYFVSPIDLIPDLIPGVGFADDFAILLAIYKSLHDEVEKFLSWEKTQIVKP